MSQLLTSLGMTREDLDRHTSRMRQFLDSENASKIARGQAVGDAANVDDAISREDVLAYIAAEGIVQDVTTKLKEPPATRSSHRETSSTPSPIEAATRHSRPTSNSNSLSRQDYDPDHSPERNATRRVLERGRTRTRDRHHSHTASSPFSRPKISLDEVMQLRSKRSRRVSESEESEESDEESLRVSLRVLQRVPFIYSFPPYISIRTCLRSIRQGYRLRATDILTQRELLMYALLCYYPHLC